jgi:hypothetical protein
MELRAASVCRRWRSVGIGVLLSLAAPAVILVNAEPTDAEVLRQQAVSQYIDGATKELDAFGRQISAVARPDNQQLCSLAKEKLNECDAFLADLKTAGPEQFDLIKASYERTRGDLVKALDAAKSK